LHRGSGGSHTASETRNRRKLEMKHWRERWRANHPATRIHEVIRTSTNGAILAGPQDISAMLPTEQSVTQDAPYSPGTNFNPASVTQDKSDDVSYDSSVDMPQLHDELMLGTKEAASSPANIAVSMDIYRSYSAAPTSKITTEPALIRGEDKHIANHAPATTAAVIGHAVASHAPVTTTAELAVSRGKDTHVANQHVPSVENSLYAVRSGVIAVHEEVEPQDGQRINYLGTSAEVSNTDTAIFARERMVRKTIPDSLTDNLPFITQPDRHTDRHTVRQTDDIIATGDISAARYPVLYGHGSVRAPGGMCSTYESVVVESTASLTAAIFPHTSTTCRDSHNSIDHRCGEHFRSYECSDYEQTRVCHTYATRPIVTSHGFQLSESVTSAHTAHMPGPTSS
jgi:hypothetical protein